MTGIAEVRSGGNLVYDEMRGEKPVDTSPSSVTTLTQPGETEKIFKAEEMLKRALAPNLKNLEREQVIKIQLQTLKTPEEKFPLVIELFEITVDAFKRQGLSLEELIKERRAWTESYSQFPLTNQQSFFYPCKGPHSDLKNELVSLYRHLCELAIEQHQQLISTQPLAQIFQLEKRTGYTFNGAKLLMDEFDIYCKHFSQESDFSKLKRMESFYWETLVPTFNQLMSYFDKEGMTENCEWAVRQFIDVTMHCNYPISTRPLVIENFRMANYYIVSYADLGPIKKYVFRSHPPENYNSPQLVLLWIIAACNVAEFFIEKDPSKAAEFLKEAEEMFVQHLSTPSLFSGVSTKDKENIQQRMANLKAKLQLRKEIKT